MRKWIGLAFVAALAGCPAASPTETAAESTTSVSSTKKKTATPKPQLTKKPPTPTPTPRQTATPGPSPTATATPVPAGTAQPFTAADNAAIYALGRKWHYAVTTEVAGVKATNRYVVTCLGVAGTTAQIETGDPSGDPEKAVKSNVDLSVPPNPKPATGFTETARVGESVTVPQGTFAATRVDGKLEQVGASEPLDYSYWFASPGGLVKSVTKGRVNGATTVNTTVLEKIDF